MNPLEKLAAQINAIPDPHRYVIEAAQNILAQHRLAADDLAGHLSDYGDRCARLLAAFAFDELPKEVTRLDQAARQAANRRPDEGRAIASRESIHLRARACGWTSEEIDRLLSVAGDSSRISAITWRSATVAGQAVDRAELRQSLRTTAYSNAGWEKFVSTMPRIAPPESAVE